MSFDSIIMYNIQDLIILCNIACVHVYQDFHLNRVSLEESKGSEVSPAGARPKKKNIKNYDLTAADKFWQNHKGRCVTNVLKSFYDTL